MKLITVEMLRDKGACAEQVRKFNRLFPDGAPVSILSAESASKAGLDIWFLTRFFTAPAWEAYEKAKASAREAYEKAKASAWEAYEKSMAPAWEAYEKAKASALEVYDKAEASALVAGLLAS